MPLQPQVDKAVHARWSPLRGFADSAELGPDLRETATRLLSFFCNNIGANLDAIRELRLSRIFYGAHS
ncbi:hypothetical protein B0G57_13911 [Trinickia symbiotica]|nr:hypothetical protein B0G57_13911 [Trinickia symbiotica]